MSLLRGKQKEQALMSLPLLCLCLEALCFRWSNRNCGTILVSSLERYESVNKCVQCVVLALSYILAREVLVSTLTNENITCFSEFATKQFNTESFAV